MWLALGTADTMLCGTRETERIAHFRRNFDSAVPSLVTVAGQLPLAVARFVAGGPSPHSLATPARDEFDGVGEADRSPTVADMTAQSFVDSFRYLLA